MKYCKFHRTSKALQTEELNLAVCGDLYKSLAVYLNIRKHFDSFEKTAKDILPDVDYKETTIRRRKRKKQDNDGDAADAAEDLNARERFSVYIL